MNNSVSSPIAPRRIVVSLERQEGVFMDMVDENLARVAQNNPDVVPAAVSRSGSGTNKTRQLLPAPLSQGRNLNRASAVATARASRMTLGGDGEPIRSALAPRTEAVNGSLVDKNYSAKPVMSSSVMPPASEGPRWRAASTPPRPNTSQQTTRTFDAERNRIPKPPRDVMGSPKVRASSSSIASQKSAPSPQVPPPLPNWQWDPESQEQTLFEQRLCEDAYGVAVRKINQNGKAQLRYVKCVPYTPSDDDNASSQKSVSSLVRSFSSLRSREKRKDNDDNSDTDKLLSDVKRLALVWGKKKDHILPVDRFVSVHVGKTTDRTRRNPQPASRLLSLITRDGSLDIEAPTRLDRDKFARAFARFLRVPLIENGEEAVRPTFSAAISAPDLDVIGIKPDIHRASVSPRPRGASVGETPRSRDDLDVIPLSRNASDDEGGFDVARSQNASSSATSNILQGKEFIASGPVVSGFSPDAFKSKDDRSVVSSLTGGNYDQDIVEELHNALEGLKTELEESRAEAARAVKVAEQAIQSAENSNSKDWNSTVTHKAAEAAALAQKRSAEAMAKQRLAEERLAGERKNASFWRKQAEAAEEEAGVLQTRAAAAEVQRAAITEELHCERQRTLLLIESLKKRFDSADIHQREALEAAMERNRALEIELSANRRDLNTKSQVTNKLEDELHQANFDAAHLGSIRKKLNLLGKSKKRHTNSGDTTSLLSYDSPSSDALEITETNSGISDSLPIEDVLKLHAEFEAIRLQFELLKRTTSDELNALPKTTQLFANQASAALVSSQAEVARLQQRLALESNTRRKLLHEVQDLRGTVRVYCRPRPFVQPGTNSLTGTLSLPSNEILVLHRERLPSAVDTTPLSFEFDRIFSPGMDQREVYSEVEELVLCALDGYNVCLMAYGQSGSGKTYTMLGDVSYPGNDIVEITNYGIHLQGVLQLLTVSEHRSDRYEDRFTLSIVEVTGEKLCDLISGTAFGDSNAIVGTDASIAIERKGSKASKRSEDEAFSQMSSKSRKLEIRTNDDGETIVQGVVTVNISSIDDVIELWTQTLSLRASRLKEMGTSLESHEAASHMIVTLRVVSTNIATGVGTQGKIQFVEFAGADLTPQRSSAKSKGNKANDHVLVPVGNKFEWKYANKSLATVLDVVTAKTQFVRAVPYRNSTVTHLLQDALEGDTKVMMLLCVSADPKDMQQTASALRLGTKMKRVSIGKATKHAIQR